MDSNEIKRFGACGCNSVVDVWINEFKGNVVEINWSALGGMPIADAKEFQVALAEAIEYAESLEAK